MELFVQHATTVFGSPGARMLAEDIADIQLSLIPTVPRRPMFTTRNPDEILLPTQMGTQATEEAPQNTSGLGKWGAGRSHTP